MIEYLKTPLSPCGCSDLGMGITRREEEEGQGRRFGSSAEDRF
ncbi:hypothetical protein ABID26_001073 [Mesorhizobium shonense]|uniref:Propionyl-coenzyme A carboxylase alpha polypeptide n=1 Tax=Mesorhizobium shonense TaxID=1209948 RepID=A0ABV2HMA4_9HYPH|nr:hypothetical protein [Mesorhizobium sp.]